MPPILVTEALTIIAIDEEAWETLYKHISHPITYKNGKKIAVRVISQFGEESTKVITL